MRFTPLRGVDAQFRGMPCAMRMLMLMCIRRMVSMVRGLWMASGVDWRRHGLVGLAMMGASMEGRAIVGGV